MPAKTHDTLYLAIGGLAIAGAGVWAFVQQSSISALREAPSVPAGGAAYEPAAIVVTSPASRTWASPGPQSSGGQWIYDVFTPPKIYYNTETKQFTVVPPRSGPIPDTPPPPPPTFGLELLKVEQPLFRLQLVGYVGEGAEARGNFLNVQTGAVIFGTTGKKLPDLKLEIVSFSAERRVVPQPGGTTLVFTEVQAVVRDTETGKETKLDARSRVPDGAPVATFKLEDSTERQARAGETLQAGEHSYKIEALTLEPPSAVAVKQGVEGTEPETKTLTVPPPAPPPPPEGETTGMEPPPPNFPAGAFPGF